MMVKNIENTTNKTKIEMSVFLAMEMTFNFNLDLISYCKYASKTRKAKKAPYQIQYSTKCPLTLVPQL